MNDLRDWIDSHPKTTAWFLSWALVEWYLLCTTYMGVGHV